MADTPLELSMDQYVRQNLTWNTWVQFRNPDGDWQTNRADIKEGLDYRIGFKVTNVGSETYVKNVQIRIANSYPDRVTFFSDNSFSQPVSRQSQVVFPDILAPGQFTPWNWVHIRLGPGPDERVSIAEIGVYAEIIPLGHYWDRLEAPLD